MTAVSTVLLVLLTLLFPVTARADDNFDTAAEAYRNQDYRRAFTVFSRLAEAGDARAQSVLAIMYKYGESVPIDHAMSYQWYRRAAEQDYPPAQYHVGVMLAQGIGVETDLAEARDWLRRAAGAGYEKASDRLAEIEGGAALDSPPEEPVAWSQRWNLRLPNDLRFDDNDALDNALRVYRVQLGAMSSIEAAQALWQQLLSRVPDLGSRQPIFREGRSGDRAVFRVQVGPFSRREEASSFCELLRQTRNSCLVLLTD